MAADYKFVLAKEMMMAMMMESVVGGVVGVMSSVETLPGTE